MGAEVTVPGRPLSVESPSFRCAARWLHDIDQVASPLCSLDFHSISLVIKWKDQKREDGLKNLNVFICVH